MVVPSRLRSLLTSINSTLASLSVSISLSSVALALPVPDATLGTQNTPLGPGAVQIDGGTTVGQNLFHSFDSFNIDTGEFVYFFSPADVNHIFSRVTGATPSEIDGVLGTVGSDADLFLMNPNGVMFGTNASLDVEGSFIVTTADAIEFAGAGSFGTAELDSELKLLTINPSAFLFNPGTTGTIENRSRADAGRSPNNAFNAFGMGVPDGRNISFIGGDILTDSGGLVAFGGDINLSSVAGTLEVEQRVGYKNAGSSLSLMPADIRGNIIHTNDAGFIVMASDDGSISLYGNNIEFSNGGSMDAGILSGLGSEDAQAGDISIDATGRVIFSGPDRSSLENDVSFNAVGNSGAVNIRAASLELRDLAFISSTTNGQGNSGGISIETTGQVSLIQEGPLTTIGQPATLLASRVFENGNGNSGDISIDANSLNVSNAQISTTISGNGNSGNVIIQVDEGVELLRSGDIFTEVTCACETNNGIGGVGQGGDIIIDAHYLSLSDGSNMRADTEAMGNGGNIIIDVQDQITIEGADDRFTTGIFSQSEFEAMGNGGNIEINTGSLSLTGDGEINVQAQGTGNAGTISITATENISLDGPDAAIISQVQEGATGNGGRIYLEILNNNVVAPTNNILYISNNAQINSSTSGNGRAGDVILKTDGRITLDNGLIFSDVTDTGRDSGGNVNISAGIFDLLNGAQIQTVTDGLGAAGNIVIHAEQSIHFDSVTSDGRFPSALLSFVGSGSTGVGGNIELKADSLEVANGALIDASTFGNSAAGNIDIEVNDNVVVDGTSTSERWRSGIFSTIGTDAQGEGGNLIVSAETLEVLNGAIITASVFGIGSAGDVIINTRDQTVVSGTTPNGISSLVLSRVEAGGKGHGGNVRINTDSLEISNAAAVSASTQGVGDAGDVIINAQDTINISSVFEPNADTAGIGGIFTRNFNLGVIGTGAGGNITISTPELNLSEGGVLDAQTANENNGGDISLEVHRLSLFDGGQILVASSNAGSAGTVNINAQEEITISGIDPDFEKRGFSLTDSEETYTPESSISVISLGSGSAGNILIDSPTLVLTDEGELVAESATVDGGDIILNLEELLLLRNRSQITATAGIAQGEGRGGNITINSPFIVAIPSENSDITANAFAGSGGQVVITAEGVFGIEPRPNPTPLSDITASSALGVVGGAVTLNSPDTSFIQNSLTELPDTLVNPDALVASSCVAHNQDTGSTFVITGNSIANTPNSASPVYSTGTVQIPNINTVQSMSQAAIIEPAGIYQTTDGRLVMSKEC